MDMNSNVVVWSVRGVCSVVLLVCLIIFWPKDDTNVPYEGDVVLVPGTAMNTNSIEVDAGWVPKEGHTFTNAPASTELMSITGGDITVSASITIGPVSINTNGTVTIKEGVTMDEASKEFWMRVQALAQQWMYE